jgi:GDP-L-fucose synthase
VSTFNSLADKRIVVTGPIGFLGRNILSVLKARHYGNVIPAPHSDYDLTRMDDVERLYRVTKPDVLIHAAALVGGIGANSASPGSFFYANISMGLNLMEAARVAGLEKFVQIGTVCSYPKLCPVPFREESLWDGYPEETNAPYGIAKKALLVQGQAYREQYGLNSIYLILVNLYGPEDNFDPSSSHVIPALIRKFVDAKERGLKQVEVWGTGKATREFLYVTDAAEAIVAATEMYDGAKPVNIGAGREISIRDLAQLIKDEVQFDGEIVWDKSKPDGQPRRMLDVSRAEQLFGFKAKTDFAEGLRKTIEWYRASRSVRAEAVDNRL